MATSEKALRQSGFNSPVAEVLVEAWSKISSTRSGTVLLLLFVVVDCFIFYLNPSKASFWDIDSSLFLRYANDPDFFHYTSPAIAKTIEASPSFTRDIFSFLSQFGITYNSNYLVLYMGTVFCATFGVYLSAFLILRSFRVDALAAALLVIVLLNSWFVIDYSRLHPLKNVMKHGGLSMLASSIFLLSIGFHIYGRTLIALCLAVGVSLIHPVVGLLTTGFIFGSAVIYKLYERKALYSSLDVILGAGGLCFILAFVFLRLEDGVFSPAGEFDKDLYFNYIYFRSSNPMPLRDGVVVLLSHMFVFVSVLYLCATLGRKHTRQKIIISSLCCLWFAGVLAQIVFGEVLQSVSLVRLVLHRSSPMLFLLFGVMLTYLVWSNARKERRYSGFLLLVATFLLFMAGRSVFHEFSIFDLQAANIILWSGLMVSLCLYDRQAANAPNYVRFSIGTGVVLMVSLLFGAGAELKNILDDSAILPLMLFVGAIMFVSAVMKSRLAKGRRWVTGNSLMTALGCIVLVVFVVKLFLYLNISDQQNIKRNVVYKKYDIIQLLERHTGKRDVVYTLPGMDINGVRKAYLDWVHSWYTLYSLSETSRVVLKLKTLGIDIQNDNLAYGQCGGWNWLFRFRCHRVSGKVDERLRGFDWRGNWEQLQAVEPHLKFALIMVDQVRPEDKIVGVRGKYALISR